MELFFTQKLNEDYAKHRKNLNEIFENYLRERNQTREEILIAFIAKFGCEPDEIVQIQQNTANGIKYWVEKGSKIDRVKIPIELRIEKEARIEAQKKIKELENTIRELKEEINSLENERLENMELEDL